KKHKNDLLAKYAKNSQKYELILLKIKSIFSNYSDFDLFFDKYLILDKNSTFLSKNNLFLKQQIEEMKNLISEVKMENLNYKEKFAKQMSEIELKNGENKTLKNNLFVATENLKLLNDFLRTFETDKNSENLGKLVLEIKKFCEKVQNFDKKEIVKISNFSEDSSEDTEKTGQKWSQEIDSDSVICVD
ncbi:hypothetical protein MHBO_002625, partial [Bonamia ostreae]